MQTAIPDAVPSTSTPSITSQTRETLELEKQEAKEETCEVKGSIFITDLVSNYLAAKAWVLLEINK